jgi:hypothetical protein
MATDRVQVQASLAVGGPPVQEFFWHLSNRLRRVVGLKNRARPCCRKTNRQGEYINLGPPQVASSDGKVVVRRCTVCRARHFEAEAPKGAFGVKL